jgi:hypothetical protein
MKFTEATVFDRKSGAAEGPAVRPGSRAKVSVPLVLPQNRHPACPGVPWERSASPIDRVTHACGAESKDPGGAHLTRAVRSFSTTEPHLGGPARSFPGTENQELASIV